MDLPEFLAMLEGRDATDRVAALESARQSVFEATEDEANALFHKVILMLKDPVWDVQRAAIQVLSELSGRFDLDALHCLNRQLFHPDPKLRMMSACVLTHVDNSVDDAEDYYQVYHDRWTAEAALSRQGQLLEFLHASFKADRELVLTVVKQDGHSLKYANPHLQDDDEIVLAAVAQSGRAVQFASQQVIARHLGLRELRGGRGLCLFGDYLVLEVIGHGVCGNVAKAQHLRTKKVVAIKKMSYDREVWVDGIPAPVVREMTLLRKCRHQNVVKLLDVNLDCKDARVFMIFELLPTDLRKVLSVWKQTSQLLPFEQVRDFSENILSGLFECHTRQILHRDLKPENILLGNDGVLKIADFGLSRLQGHHLLTNLTQEVVTLWYRSPELLLGAKAYGFEVDCWSAGCVIAEMCTGSPLFAGETEAAALLKIFQLLGIPSQTNWPQGTQLHQFVERFPAWSATGLKNVLEVRPELQEDKGDELLSGLLHLQPDQRLSSRRARCHQFCRPCPECSDDDRLAPK
ncbi:CDK3 [Symbiodinium natans]|uniref:Cyclin-dependent kinase 2 homolog n=1 Tax=Symbiodinium natans TaxID=878477 RepID=A0A812QYD3_9DINO|nr:CDK3 [Symbiodinium natans]